MTESDKSAAMALIQTTTDVTGLKGCDLVVEAATENEAIKVKILQAVEAVVGHDVLIATNTSSLSVTRLAAQLQQPNRFVGMHFFNPVPMMPLSKSFESANPRCSSRGDCRIVQGHRQDTHPWSRTARALWSIVCSAP